MSDQLPMFGLTTSEDIPSVTSSPGSESGAMPCDLLDGQMTDKSGPVPVPVSPSVRPAKAKRSTTKGIFGQSGFHSSKHDDLSFALANKLRPLTDSLGSTLFSLTWMTRITPAGRSICALRASGPLTKGSVFIGWPTPNAGPQNDQDSRWEQRREQCREKHINGNGFGLNLGMASTLAAWPTPNTPSGGPNTKTTETHTGGMDLDGAATLSAWGTPAARDWKSGAASQDTLDKNARPLNELVMLAGWKTPTACSLNSLRGSGQEPCDREAGGHAVNLQDQVRLVGWKTPCVPNGGRISGTAHQSMDSGAGPIGYLLGPNGWEIVPASGQLNASHSRWLMGLPREWDQAGIAAFLSHKKRRRVSPASGDTETE